MLFTRICNKKWKVRHKGGMNIKVNRSKTSRQTIFELDTLSFHVSRRWKCIYFVNFQFCLVIVLDKDNHYQIWYQLLYEWQGTQDSSFPYMYSFVIYQNLDWLFLVNSSILVRCQIPLHMHIYTSLKCISTKCAYIAQTVIFHRRMTITTVTMLPRINRRLM